MPVNNIANDNSVLLMWVIDPLLDKAFEVLRKRNKRSQTCIESWVNDDEYIVSRIVENLGCRPPHWNVNTSLPECVKKGTMEEISKYTPHLYSSYPNPPCQSLSHILGSQEEPDSLSYNPYTRDMKGIFEVKMRFEAERFMLIEQTRSYDIESLIGNSGGYLGLFLGCAILQIPQGLAFMFKLVKYWKA